MGPIGLLREIVVIATASVLVTVILGRLKLPTVAGLVFCGALVGPHAMSLASDVHAIEVIAEVGVVFLLFTIGLEFSLTRLKHIFRQVALGGFLQVVATAAVATGIGIGFGLSTPEAVVYGFAFALSSTALVLRTLSERNELDAPHGRFIVGTLIFQDLCIVPMVLMVPLLSTGLSDWAAWSSLGIALGKALLMVVVMLFTARLLVPRLLSLVDASRSREVFILAVLSLCIGTAYLTSLAGLSLALGAFLGGMVVADTEFSHRAMGDVLPLRDIFVSFFFVSLGMFFDLDVVMEHSQEVGLLLLAFLVGKGVIATLAATLMRFPPRAAWLAGVGLAQFGEFGFVILQLAISEGVVQSETVAPLLNAGIISMFLTPIFVHRAPHITAGERVLDPLAKLMRARSADDLEAKTAGRTDHVVVIGYGLAGQLMCQSLRNLDIEAVVLELNSENVALGRERGDPVFYADATSEEALGHAHVEDAKAVVVMINDYAATRRVVAALRRLVPSVPIFVRTEYLTRAQEFVQEGISDVVACEVEGGLELLSRVLRRLEVPRNLINREVQHARNESMVSERRFTSPPMPLKQHGHLDDMLVESCVILPGALTIGATPKTLGVAQETGALVVAIRRDSTLITHNLADTLIQEGDVVYCIGTNEALANSMTLFSTVQDTELREGAPSIASTPS